MRITMPPPKISDTEGFSPEKDIFGREDLGRGLTNLVTRVRDPLVILVDGQWGSGKTTFLKMWAGHLRQQRFSVVLFDAFEADYAEDAFTAIAGEIFALVQEKRKTTSKVAKQFVSTAIKTTKILMRSGLKLGAKAAARAASAGLLDSKDFSNTVADLGEEASDVVDRYLGELITAHGEEKEAIQRFRDSLSELPKLLATDDAEGNSKPLIFIIDEIDRCRPLFALQVLERIKHFFSVPNVHFIFGAHMSQLRNSVRNAYGADLDAQTYLEKFVHLVVPLVDAKSRAQDRDITKHILQLRRTLEFPNDSAPIDATLDLVRYVAERRNLSFRKIERIVTNLALALAVLPSNSPRLWAIVAGLCIIKVTKPDLYLKAKIGLIDYSEVSAELVLHELPNDEFKSIVRETTTWWQVCTGVSKNEQLVARLSFDYNFDNARDLIAMTANSFVDRWTDLP